MRKRVLQAVVSAVAVAVVLLGVPLAWAVVQNVRDDAISNLDLRVQTAQRTLESRIELGGEVSSAMLENYVSPQPGATAYIEVTLADGTRISAGEEPQRALTATSVGDSGLVVAMYMDWWDVFLDGTRFVALVVAAGLVAIVAGIATATWQANRLSAPLVYLAASAEQMGSGQVRPKLHRSGIEEIDLVAEELSRSADRMSARLAAERQFAADASHQLRTPLTALTMRLEEISMATERDDVREEAERGLEQVERLTGVVDDLLGRTRKALGAGTQAVELDGILDQQRTEWTRAFEEAGRNLVIHPCHLSVFATPGGLSQVLATLIENSLHHGDGTTVVSARATGATRAVVVEVGDDGEGVRDEIAGRIFDREFSGGSGTGLGLALARDLVTADGGRLELAQRRPAVFAVFLQASSQMVDLDDVIPHRRVGPR